MSDTTVYAVSLCFSDIFWNVCYCVQPSNWSHSFESACKVCDTSLPLKESRIINKLLLQLFFLNHQLGFYFILGLLHFSHQLKS